MNNIIIFILISLSLAFVYKLYTNPFKRAPKKMKSLQDNWKLIANEAANLPNNIVDAPVTHREQKDWVDDEAFSKLRDQFNDKSGWLYGWNADSGGPNREWMNWGIIVNGQPCGKNAELCPYTTELLTSIPGIKVAGFSMMMPRSKIYPHSDATGKEFGSMAYHLGLDCPNECNMVIGNTNNGEKNGKTFIFDATDTHWAENKSDNPRMILYIDYEI